MNQPVCDVCHQQKAIWRFGLLSDYHIKSVCDNCKEATEESWSKIDPKSFYVNKIWGEKDNTMANDQFMLIPNEDGTWRKEPFTRLEDIAKEQTISDQVSSLEYAYENLKLQNADYREWLEETEKLLSKALVALTGSGQNKLVEDIEKYLREHTNVSR